MSSPFRQFKLAVPADIEGSFWQVAVRPMDRHSLRFLWREGKFGTLLELKNPQLAPQQTFRLDGEMHSAVVNAVLEKFFMDDFLGSVAESKEVFHLSSDRVKLLSLGVFEVPMFVSNGPGLAARIKTIQLLLKT